MLPAYVAIVRRRWTWWGWISSLLMLAIITFWRSSISFWWSPSPLWSSGPTPFFLFNGFVGFRLCFRRHLKHLWNFKFFWLVKSALSTFFVALIYICFAVWNCLQCSCVKLILITHKYLCLDKLNVLKLYFHNSPPRYVCLELDFFWLK